MKINEACVEGTILTSVDALAALLESQDFIIQDLTKKIGPVLIMPDPCEVDNAKPVLQKSSNIRGRLDELKLMLERNNVNLNDLIARCDL